MQSLVSSRLARALRITVLEKRIQVSNTFLSRDELAELTGAKTKARQIAVLQRNGIRHWINAAGQPLVPRCVLAGVAPDREQDQAWVPNKTR